MPDPPRSVVEAIWRELNWAKAELRPVAQIRVTPSALPLSPVAVPITPERARLLALRAVDCAGTVVADREVTDRYVEVVVHPTDWYDLLRSVSALGVVDQLGTRCFGVKVIT